MTPNQNSKNNTPQQIIQAIQNSKNPLVTMDSRADFDAICSCVIMHNYITKKLNKTARFTFDGTIPDSITDVVSKYADISFLEQEVCPAKDIDFSQYDLHIFMDSGNLDHICNENLFEKPKNSEITTINIDHHSGNNFYGDLNYVIPCGSTCTILFEIFKTNQIEIDTSLINIFYLGTLLDTGFFLFDSTTSKDFRMVAELMDLGAETFELNWMFTFNESLELMRLKGLVYSNLKVVPEIKVAYSTLSLKEMAEKGIDYSQLTYPPSDMIKKLEGMDFVFVVRESENEPGTYSLSFRSHAKDFSVLDVAQRFGGGGHKMATGAYVKADSIDDAVSRVLEVVRGN